jgi:hypothetical protein
MRLECGFGFKNPGMCGKRKSFQREERGWEAQREKEFWIGCRTHFRAVLVRRTPAAVCHKDPCPLQYFFAVWGWAAGLWPPTRFFRVPCNPWPGSAQLGAKIAWMWGKGRSDGEPWKKACLTLPALLLWQSVPGEEILGCRCLRLHCSLLLPESHMRNNLTWSGTSPSMGCEPRAVGRRRRESALHVALSFEETEIGNPITVDVSRSRVRLPISLIRLPFSACSLAEPGPLDGFLSLDIHSAPVYLSRRRASMGPPRKKKCIQPISQEPANA